MLCSPLQCVNIICYMCGTIHSSRTILWFHIHSFHSVLFSLGAFNILSRFVKMSHKKDLKKRGEKKKKQGGKKRDEEENHPIPGCRGETAAGKPLDVDLSRFWSGRQGTLALFVCGGPSRGARQPHGLRGGLLKELASEAPSVTWPFPRPEAKRDPLTEDRRKARPTEDGGH